MDTYSIYGVDILTVTSEHALYIFMCIKHNGGFLVRQTNMNSSSDFSSYTSSVDKSPPPPPHPMQLKIRDPI